MIIVDYFNRLTDKVPTDKDKERFEELKKMTTGLINKYAPVMVINGNEYPMGQYDNLNCVEPNTEVEVSEIQGDPAMKNRLNGVGIIKGSKIKLIRKGLGLKVYDVLGGSIALRNEDARKIKVIK